MAVGAALLLGVAVGALICLVRRWQSRKASARRNGNFDPTYYREGGKSRIPHPLTISLPLLLISVFVFCCCCCCCCFLFSEISLVTVSFSFSQCLSFCSCGLLSPTVCFVNIRFTFLIQRKQRAAAAYLNWHCS